MEKRKFHRYEIYEDGRVYSTITNKFLKGDITKHGYLQFRLSVEGKSKVYKAHQLVALLWLKNLNGYKVVNHIDGNKLNNHYTNLEWCSISHNNKHARDTGLNNISETNSNRWKDDEFRKRVSANISQGRKLKGSSKGRRNPKFRYEIVQEGKLISREELKELLGLAMSTIDQKIKKSAEGKRVKEFEIHNIKIRDTKKGQSTIENVA